MEMFANRKHFVISFLILVLLIITMSCYSLDQAYDNWQPRAATKADQNTNPQVVPNPDAEPQQETENNQPSDANPPQQPGQQPDPEPQADPEPELSELEKCVANKDVVIINGDVIVNQTSDETTSNFTNLTCDYTTKILSEASQPVVILYQWNEYYKDYPDKNESVFHWRFHGPMPTGGEKVLFQELTKYERALLYKRLVSYVAIYDTPQCKQYINSIEIMRQTRSVFFECDQYIPKP
jgi:hypothetical protein